MFRLAFIVLFSLLHLFPLSQDQPKRIVFFGDSITAGYAIPIESAFPALIQKKIEEAGLNYKVVNAGLSGETTAGGLNRIDWILRSKPDVFVLELGGNDGLRGLSMEESEKNLKAMIAKVRKANPKAEIILAGMQIPPNLGQEYTSKFKSLFPNVAKEMNTKLIPFLLEGVGGDPKLNLSDGIHPNQKGHEIVAETVWGYLKPLL
ncbi:arylesterase [uncultured Roseivirga sp.]|uniref:arylesterase n=1 Tax=uncultured Roseivirga sp. TaxID=543088 RepID=UPI000D799460|nr:arylesterase [uncultured Roseivirga sp.]PWL31047.1 MAG: arylesterase [Roseivirga sp. XM-24bin3]